VAFRTGAAAGRAMEALLAGVSPADPVTLLSAVAVAVLMTLAGCLAPALRAERLDPIAAIRTGEARRRFQAPPQPSGLKTRFVEAGNFPRFDAGRMGRCTSSPPQLGQSPRSL